MSPHLAEHGRAPILILGWGNVARGDDALGPLALQAAEQLAARGQPRGYVAVSYTHLFFPDRRIDASHPDVVLELNRCILCELCVRASREIDGKNVFALAGRGMASHLVINSESGRLVDSDFAITDYAARVCPVGVFLKRTGNFGAPIGDRTYDGCPISSHAAAHALSLIHI